jgi:hypothetical protein
MADSKDVLSGLIWVYTLYFVTILSVMIWFAYRITSCLTRHNPGY